MNRRSKTSSLR